MDHSRHSDSGLLKVFVADSTLTCFWLVTKVCHSPDEKFPASKVLESSVCLVGQALEERALAWSSPFKLAKMITIWPQNRCISPGLAGNRDFVFPLGMACLHPPSSPMLALARGAKLLLWAASQCTLQRILLKINFFEMKDIFAIAGGFWTKSDSKVSAAVSRLVLEACPSMVRWLHSSWHPNDQRLALESL